MAMLFLGGELMNLLESASITPTPAENSLLPATALCDGDPGSMFAFGSLTDAPKIVFDLDLMGGIGGMESWTGTTPDGWTELNTGAGHVDEQVGGVIADGARSAEFDNDDGGAATSSLHVDVVLRTLQRLKIASSLAADALASDDMLLRLRNQESGKFLTVAATWNSTAQHVHPTTPPLGGAAMEAFTTNFTMEDYAACGTLTPTLRLQLFAPNTGQITYADAVYLTPAVSFCSIHGHNIDPRCGLVLESSDDNSSWTTRATFTIRKPSMYVSFTPVYARYWRLQFSGTNSAVSGPIRLGEVVLGDYITLSRGPLYPFRRSAMAPQIRIERQVGGPAIKGHGLFEQTSVPLTFRVAASERDTYLNEVYRRCMRGAPCVIVPSTSASHPPDVFFGVLSAEFPEEWPAKGYLEVPATFEELALPLMTG